MPLSARNKNIFRLNKKFFNTNGEKTMNLYEILEVSENASMETINKIYKIQAKKYHPDLQTNAADKLKAEEKMKQINDAYSVLSDEQKRKEYDQKLEREREIKRQQDEQNIINNVARNYSEAQKRNQTNNTINNNSNVQKNAVYYNKQKSNENNNQRVYTEKDYIRDYNKKLRRFKAQLFGNKIKENLKALGIMFIIILIIWFFPPTHNFIVNLYEENIVLQTLVSIIKKIFIAIKDTIKT